MATQEYGRLDEAGLEWYSRRGCDIKAEAFFTWVRETKKEKLTKKWWPRLYTAQPVPWRMLELLDEYCKTRRPTLTFSLDEIAVKTEEKPAPFHNAFPWYVKFWFVLWEMILGVFTRSFSEDELAACKTIDDVKLAARRIIEWIGRHQEEDADAALELSDDEAYARGTKVMKRTAEQFTKQLAGYWREQPDCIRFAVRDGERVGLFVTLPANAEAWQKFRDGELYDTDLLPEHLLKQSFRLIVPFCADWSDDEKMKKQHDKAMRVCMANQIALLSEPVAWFISERQLHLLSVGGSAESVRVLEGAGYTATGTVLPRAKKPLYEMTPTSVRGTANRFMYAIMIAVVSFIQHLRHVHTRIEGDQ